MQPCFTLRTLLKCARTHLLSVMLFFHSIVRHARIIYSLYVKVYALNTQFIFQIEFQNGFNVTFLVIFYFFLWIFRNYIVIIVFIYFKVKIEQNVKKFEWIREIVCRWKMLVPTMETTYASQSVSSICRFFVQIFLENKFDSFGRWKGKLLAHRWLYDILILPPDLI